MCWGEQGLCSYHLPSRNDVLRRGMCLMTHETPIFYSFIFIIISALHRFRRKAGTYHDYFYDDDHNHYDDCYYHNDGIHHDVDHYDDLEASVLCRRRMRAGRLVQARRMLRKLRQLRIQRNLFFPQLSEV